METLDAKLLLEASLILGEGPVWHSGMQKFLFVDIKGKRLGWIDPQASEHNHIPLDDMPGMVAPIEGSDKLLIAFQNSIDEFDLITRERVTLTGLEADMPHNRANDGACDANGRLWIGTMHINAELNQGAIYCFDGTLRKVIGGLSVPNGLCWSADGRKMYHIDSFAYSVKAYDFDADTGSISNDRVVVSISPPDTPDGMCIDEEGMLWIAIWGGGCVNSYNPANGQLMSTIIVDAPYVTSCAFGGRNMKQMLITTAADGLNREQLEQYPLSGSLFIVDLPIAGKGPNAYRHKPI